MAGAAPTSRVHALCQQHHWELVADFASLSDVAVRARVAVAPLSRVAGIQNKVLDAACLGLAQVATPQALEGFAPDLPLTGHDEDASFIAEVVRLLDDPVTAHRETDVVRAHVALEYGTDRWRGWAESLLA